MLRRSKRTIGVLHPARGVAHRDRGIVARAAISTAYADVGTTGSVLGVDRGWAQTARRVRAIMSPAL